jgi:fructokinase
MPGLKEHSVSAYEPLQAPEVEQTWNWRRMSFKIIGIGEVLWDLLPVGPKLGGAPANFAYHAHALGGRASVVTRVGDDMQGSDILARFKEFGFPNETVQVDEQAPTGTVTVRLNGDGIPHYTIHENVAWDRLLVTPPALAAVREANAICFGTLAQRHATARATIQRLVAAAPADAWRVFDINLRQKFFSREIIEQSLRLANVLKLNDSELPVLADLFDLGDSPRDQIEQLANGFGLRLVALTRGPQGSLLFRDGSWSEQAPQPVEVVDTVGAGDAFTAALVMGLLLEMKLDELHAWAAEMARHVCSQAGATPAIPVQIREKCLIHRGHAHANIPNLP